MVTLTNDATALPLSWTAKVDGPYALQGPTSGQLFSHESATVTILPEIPGTAEAAFPVPGTLRFLTNDPAHPTIEVPLAAIARGATLAFPSSVDFGDVPLSATSPDVPLTVKNTGNLGADFEVAIAPGSDFAPGGANLHVEAGASGSALFHFTPTTWGQKNGSLTVKVKGPVCGVGSSVIPLTGRGTRGVVLTSPGKLDFGLVDCGTQAQAKTVVVENVGDAPFDVSAALTSGVSFTLSPTLGTVQPGGSLILTVAPNGVPAVSAVTPDLYSDTLTITTTALGDLPHVVDLHETARGAILDLTLTVQAGRALVDGVKTLPFSITNTGNASVNVSATSTDGVFQVPSTPVPANGQLVGTMVEARPVPLMIGRDYARTLLVTASGPMCGAPPVPSATVHGYDTALDLDMRGDGVICVVGHAHRVYCQQGANWWYPIPIPPQQFTGKMDWVPGFLAEHVVVNGDAFCTFLPGQATCFFNGPNIPALILLPGFTTPFPATQPQNFHFCGTAPGNPLRCVGSNQEGHWGTGTESGNYTGSDIAMGGVLDIVGYASNIKSGYAVTATGSVMAAGSQYMGSLGTTLVPEGTLALDPVAVEGMTDAAQISASGVTACVARKNGKVSCWGNGNPVVAEVGSFTDAVEVVTRLGGTYGSGCARRANGVVRCWGFGTVGDGLVNQPYHEADIAFASSVQKIVGAYAGDMCAIEVGGKVECIGVAPTPVMGFEGP